MPLYVYTCPDCEVELEELRPIDMADWPVECPVCYGFAERQISSFNVGRHGHGHGHGHGYDGGTVETASDSTESERVPVMSHGPSCPCCGPRQR